MLWHRPSGVWYNSAMIRRLPLVFTPQPEGGFTVTSPAIPELITEGDTLEEAFANVSDAFAAVLELYSQDGRSLPPATPDSPLSWPSCTPSA